MWIYKQIKLEQQEQKNRAEKGLIIQCHLLLGLILIVLNHLYPFFKKKSWGCAERQKIRVNLDLVNRQIRVVEPVPNMVNNNSTFFMVYLILSTLKVVPSILQPTESEAKSSGIYENQSLKGKAQVCLIVRWFRSYLLLKKTTIICLMIHNLFINYFKKNRFNLWYGCCIYFRKYTSL